MKFNFINLVEYIGTFAFAISGIRMAAQQRFDWFGAYVVGFITAVGGGTIRDLLLDLPPFWMNDGSYLLCTAIAFACVIIFKKQIEKVSRTIFIFDTIGLCLFVVVGIEKTLALGTYPFWLAIIMGVITGAAGGILRDVLLNNEPLIFRKEIYASACVAGGIVYWICTLVTDNTIVIQAVTAASIFVIRSIAVKYKIGLPVMKE